MFLVINVTSIVYFVIKIDDTNYSKTYCLRLKVEVVCESPLIC